MNKFLHLGIAGILLLASLCTMADTTTVSLRLIETSDVHGRFFPYDFTENKPTGGSMARVSSYVDSLRTIYGGNLLLVDNGDILQGQPSNYWSNIVEPSQPNIASEVVNYMGYNLQNFGNHDVETGHAVFDKWVKELNCPVIGANIIETATGEPYVKPYVIEERQGVRVAFIGMVTNAIPCWLNEQLYAGLRFDNMVESARKWVKIVKEQERADVVIGLFHSGWEGGILTSEVEENAAKSVAEQVKGFDLIFFGHDHTPHASNLLGEQSVLCLDPGCWAAAVADAKIDLTLENGKVINKTITGKTVSMAGIRPNQQMMDHFAPRINQIKAWAGRTIATLKGDMTTRDCFFGPSPFTDLIHNLQLQITGADISITAPLSFDSSINAGPITVADMFKIYRFENKLYVMKLTGKEIRQHLEMSYDQWVNTMHEPTDHLMRLSSQTGDDQQRMGFEYYTFNFDSAAGIDYEVDVTKPDGEKVKILRMSNGKTFDENAVYNVAMNSYRGNGGGELLTKGAGIPKEKLADRIVYQSPLDLRHYLIEELTRMGSVVPKANQNWKFVPEEWTTAAAQRDRELLFEQR